MKEQLNEQKMFKQTVEGIQMDVGILNVYCGLRERFLKQTAAIMKGLDPPHHSLDKEMAHAPNLSEIRKALPGRRDV